MRWRRDEMVQTTAEAFSTLAVDHLKPLAALVSKQVPTRKGELVSLLERAMLQPQKVKELYESLEPLARTAVQEATHDPEGQLRRDRFEARYGSMPTFHRPSLKVQPLWYSGYDYDSYKRPTPLCLFLPHYNALPTDLHTLLRTFVPRPPPFQLASSEDVPATVPQTWDDWEHGKPVRKSEDVPVRVRATAPAAEHDLRAVLRLVEGGKLRVTDTKAQPTAATLRAIAEVLQGGDFYTAEDQDNDYKGDPAADLAIKAFAWPMALQAARLAARSGTTLKLTDSGRKALGKPAHEVLKAVWEKWQGTNLLDEFSRVAVKGQAKAVLSALPGRRKVVAQALAECPPGRWVKVDDFFRFLRATDRDFVLAHREYKLYLGDPYYGNFAEEGNPWSLLQGRYLLAVLFEYAATLGLVDVAYLLPQGARTDYHGHTGSDSLSCLSRYDGLQYFRLNPLGAWCLDLTERYEPPAREVARVLRVLPNQDVVVINPPLPPGDRMLLDRFGERRSDDVWRLTAERILGAVEEGGALDELTEFLAAQSVEGLPHPVEVFLGDLRHKATRLRDSGTVRLIECADETLARMLAGDPQLRGKCRQAGERGLVFALKDEAAVRKALRRLGYILPPQQD